MSFEAGEVRVGLAVEALDHLEVTQRLVALPFERTRTGECVLLVGCFGHGGDRTYPYRDPPGRIGR